MGMDTHGDPLRSLHLAHSTLSQLMIQVDDLVLKAHKMSMVGRQIMQGLDVNAFSDFLSDMASSLQEWVPRLENVATRTESSMVEEHIKEHKDLVSSLLEDKGIGHEITDNVEKCHEAIETFDVNHGACVIGEEKGEENDEQEDWTLSNSPLVPYLDRAQFFMLTPMAKYKKALSEPSRKVLAKGIGTIPYLGGESSLKKHEDSMVGMPRIRTSIKDKENSSKNLQSSPINDNKKELQQTSVKCTSNKFEGHDLCSDLSSMLLLSPEMRAPLYRQLSADSEISDSPLHLSEAFSEEEIPVEMLSITPENPTHLTCVMENANTPLPPQSLVKRYSNFFFLRDDSVDSSYEKMPSNSLGTTLSSRISDSALTLCKSFKENVSGTLAVATFTTPANSNRKHVVNKGTPYPHRSLLETYSDDFGYVRESTDSICSLNRTPIETEDLSSILHQSKDLESITSEVLSPSSNSATPIHAKHQASMVNHATPLPPQSLVKRYSNFLGSSDKSKDSSPNLPCSSNINKNENMVHQPFVLEDEEETKYYTALTPSERCLRPSASGIFEMATPLPPQSLMKRYSQFLCSEEESTDLATPLTPMLAISPPKTCVLMRPNQTNATMNLKQSFSHDNRGCIETPHRTPGLMEKISLDHAFYEDMDLTNLKKPNQQLQKPFETTKVMTPSSDMQLLTVKKPYSIKRTPVVDMQLLTVKKSISIKRAPLVDIQFSTIKKPGAPLPGEQTLKRELWSRMEAEFSSMENVCKSLFTESLPPPPPKYVQIQHSDIENRNPNPKLNTRNMKPAVGKPLLARRIPQKQVSRKKAF